MYDEDDCIIPPSAPDAFCPGSIGGGVSLRNLVKGSLPIKECYYRPRLEPKPADKLNLKIFYDYSDFRAGLEEEEDLRTHEAASMQIARVSSDKLDDDLTFGCTSSPITDEALQTKENFMKSIDILIRNYNYMGRENLDETNVVVDGFDKSHPGMCQTFQSPSRDLVFEHIWNVDKPWGEYRHKIVETYPNDGSFPRADCVAPDDVRNVPIHILEGRLDPFNTCIWCEWGCTVNEFIKVRTEAEGTLAEAEATLADPSITRIERTAAQLRRTAANAAISAANFSLQQTVAEASSRTGQSVDQGWLEELGRRADAIDRCGPAPSFPNCTSWDCCDIIQEPVDMENDLILRHENITWGTSERLVKPVDNTHWPAYELLFAQVFGDDTNRGRQPFMRWVDTDYQSCEGAWDAIVGVGAENKNCGYGGWDELKMYQARCIRMFGLNCICDFEQTFKPGTAEEFVLRAAGAYYLDVVERRDTSTLGGRTMTRVRQEVERNEWPLAWRGYVGHHVPPDDDKNSYVEKYKRFPFLGLIDPRTGHKPKDPVTWKVLDPQRYLEDRDAFFIGANNARIGDILIWDDDVFVEKNGENAEIDMLPHVALVTDRGIDSDGNTSSLTIKEYNYGKFPDTCGVTANWGRVTTRRILPDFPPEGTFATVGDGKPQICQDPDRTNCKEKYWDELKVYRPSNDVRRSVDKPVGYGCSEVTEYLNVKTDNEVEYDENKRDNTRLANQAIDVLYSDNAGVNGSPTERLEKANIIRAAIDRDRHDNCDPPVYWMWEDGESDTLMTRKDFVNVGDLSRRAGSRNLYAPRIPAAAAAALLAAGEAPADCPDEVSIFYENAELVTEDWQPTEIPEDPPPSYDLPPFMDDDTRQRLEDLIRELLDLIEQIYEDDPGDPRKGPDYDDDIGGAGGPGDTDGSGTGPGNSSSGSGPGGGRAGGLGSCTVATYAADITTEDPQALLLATRDATQRVGQAIQATNKSQEEPKALFTEVMNYSQLAIEGFKALGAADTRANLAIDGMAYVEAAEEATPEFLELARILSELGEEDETPPEEQQEAIVQMKQQAIQGGAILLEPLFEQAQNTVILVDNACGKVLNAGTALTDAEYDSFLFALEQATELIEEYREEKQTFDSMDSPTSENVDELGATLERANAALITALLSAEEYIRANTEGVGESCFYNVGGDVCNPDITKPGAVCTLQNVDLGTPISPDYEFMTDPDPLEPYCSRSSRPLESSDAPICFRPFTPVPAYCDHTGTLIVDTDVDTALFDPFYIYNLDDPEYRDEGYSRDYVFDYLYRKQIYEYGNTKIRDWMETPTDPFDDNSPLRRDQLLASPAALWQSLPFVGPLTDPDEITMNQTIAVFVTDRYPRGHAGIVVGEDTLPDGSRCYHIRSQNWLIGSRDDQWFDEMQNCFQAYPYFGLPCTAQCIPAQFFDTSENPGNYLFNPFDDNETPVESTF